MFFTVPLETYHFGVTCPTCVSVIIAEVTQPSLGVGFELGQAVALGKKILCLFRPASEKSKQSIHYIVTVLSVSLG